MPDVLERLPGGTSTEGPPALPPLAPSTERQERPGRRALLGQIEHLEQELSGLFISTWPRKGLTPATLPGRGGPRLLSLGELEQLRDDLAARAQHVRQMLSDRTYVEEQHRIHIERMLLAPEEHRWERVTNEDIGEPGCKDWHVRPRWGVLGYLLYWWRVKISSGCPLPGGRGRWP